MTDATPRTYPQGVPSWIDLRTPDPDAAEAFYGGLFGWSFEERLPPGVPGSYRIASVDGREVGAVASSGDPARWQTYVAVDDADAVAARVVALGGAATAPRTPVPAVPRAAASTASIRAGRRSGSGRPVPGSGRSTSTHGRWVFSDLRATEPDAALAFYADLFGWLVSDMQEGPGAMLRLPATATTSRRRPTRRSGNGRSGSGGVRRRHRRARPP